MARGERGAEKLVSRLVPFLAETTTHKCAPRRANKPNRTETKTETETEQRTLTMLGLVAFNYKARRQCGKVARRRQPPASSVEKYLGHLLARHRAVLGLFGLGLAWLFGVVVAVVLGAAAASR